MELIIDRDLPIDYRGEPLVHVTTYLEGYTTNPDIRQLAEEMVNYINIEARNKGIKIMHIKIWHEAKYFPYFTHAFKIEYIGTRPPYASAMPILIGIIILALIALGIVIVQSATQWHIADVTSPVKEYTPEVPGKCKEGYDYDAKINKCVRVKPSQPPKDQTLQTVGAVLLIGALILYFTKKKKLVRW